VELINNMAKKSAWHSSEPGAKVYHNDTECNTGNNIEKENVERGEGEKRLCKECKRNH